MVIYFWNSLTGKITMKSEPTKKHKAMEHDFRNVTDCIGMLENI